MFIKQELPVLNVQNAWNNRLLQGGQQQQQQQFLDTSIHNLTDGSFMDPATLRFHIHLRQQLQHKDRRRLKAQYRRCPQLNQLTQQDIIAWAEGLSHHHQVQSCHPQQEHLHDQKYPQVNQLALFTMEDGKHFPYLVGSENDAWSVGESYGSDFLSDMSAYSSPNDGSHQTTGGYHVSGRDFGPSHPQNAHQQHLNKGGMGGSSSQLMAWPTFQPTYTDKYSPPPFAAIDTDCPRQQSMPAIFGDPSSTNYMGMHHGLPNNGWATESTMPLFGEPMSCNSQVSPRGTAYSSFSSSSASDAMASMSLHTPVGHHGFSSADMSAACPSTISPKVLRINPSPAPTSSSESTHNTLFPTGDGEFSSNSSFEQHLPSGPSPTKRLNAKGRKELPSKPTSSRYLSPSDAPSSRRSSEKHAAAHRPKHLADLKPKPAQSSPPGSPTPHLTAQEAERSKQNEFLIQSKQAGMTYREIKREGGFKEAESTLRGRYRTLTKPKTARVRKPEWTDKDIELLKTAVHKMTKGVDPTAVKIPWKKVAEYIWKNGGSYQFGNATCCKRWEELHDQEL